MVKLLTCLFMIAVISSVFLPIISRANDATTSTGNELITRCNDAAYHTQDTDWAAKTNWAMCISFIHGVQEAYAQGIMLDISTHNPKLTPSQVTAKGLKMQGFCLPENSTREQAALVVTKYLKEHPEQLNVADNLLVIRAFFAAWPCPKTSK